MLDFNKLNAEPLSAAQILKFIDGKANLVTYPEIYKYKTLDQLLGQYEAVVILYEWKDNFGHWIALFKTKPDEIEFFDPYNYMPDAEFSFIPKEFIRQHYPDIKYLSKLMYNSGYKIIYNHYPLQSKNPNIATCGKWISERLRHRNLSLSQFAKAFKPLKGYSRDDLVSLAFKYNI